MKIGGIDYSINGSCVCVHNGDTWSVDNCTWLFMTKIKKYQTSFLGGRIQGVGPEEHDIEIEKFAHNAKTIVDFIDEADCQEVYLEGYAFGATGKVFHIGENTGLLKYILYTNDIDYAIVQPTTVKKLACSTSYKIKKDEMYDAFLQETELNLRKEFDYTSKKINSPIADVVDSYYICRFGFEQRLNRNKIKP